MTSPLIDRTSVAGEAFLSDHIYELELDRIIARAWTLVALDSEIETEHAYVTSWLAGDPVIVVRQPDGSIRVLLNLCRHRGRPLVAGSGVARHFLCRHQGWTYGIDGTLIAVPTGVAESRHFDAADWGLVSTSDVVVRDGRVFARWADVDHDEAPPGASLSPTARLRSSVDIASNWKCAVETLLVHDTVTESTWITPNSAYLAGRDAWVVLHPSGVSTTTVLVFGPDAGCADDLARELQWTVRRPPGGEASAAGRVVCANTGQVCESAGREDGCALAAAVGAGPVPRRVIPPQAVPFYRRWRAELGVVPGFDDNVLVSVRSGTREATWRFASTPSS